MRRDPHILISDGPIPSGCDTSAMCGHRVKRAVFLESMEPGKRLNAEVLGVHCRKCAAIYREIKDHAERDYFYSAIDGELAINVESE